MTDTVKKPYSTHLEVGEFDMARMVAALAEPSIMVPAGLTREEMRDFILRAAAPAK